MADLVSTMTDAAQFLSWNNTGESTPAGSSSATVVSASAPLTPAMQAMFWLMFVGLGALALTTVAFVQTETREKHVVTGPFIVDPEARQIDPSSGMVVPIAPGSGDIIPFEPTSQTFDPNQVILQRIEGDGLVLGGLLYKPQVVGVTASELASENGVPTYYIGADMSGSTFVVLNDTTDRVDIKLPFDTEDEESLKGFYCTVQRTTDSSVAPSAANGIIEIDAGDGPSINGLAADIGSAGAILVERSENVLSDSNLEVGSSVTLVHSGTDWWIVGLSRGFM